MMVLVNYEANHCTSEWKLYSNKGIDTGALICLCQLVTTVYCCSDCILKVVIRGDVHTA